ncbi:type II secretion system F family protein [Pseudidiomarina sp.]|uniref:type II secretion system F family protein n=1 Tax=Pseudidiomarina sp. TaxID=2081707 RepID=UPI003A980DD3
MSMTNLYLGLLIGASAGVIYLTLNLLVQSSLPYLQSGITRLMHKLPPRLLRHIESAARQTGDAQETVKFVMEQGAMLLTLVASLMLPLPTWVAWTVCGLIALRLLRARLERRLFVRRFEKQWPNCLDMLAMLMRSGLSFSAALHALAQLPSTSIAVRQLRQLHQQLHAGVAMEVAFAAMKVRIPSAAFTSFTAAVVQARMSGSGLTNTLMLQAEQARNEQQLAAEKFAQEVGVKLLLPLVTCFFPVTFLLIIGPIFIGYFQS